MARNYSLRPLPPQLHPRHWYVAFDISLGDAPPPVAVPRDFDAFHAAHAQQIAVLLHLSSGDQHVGDAATLVALTRAAQRWSTVRDQVNPVGWVLHAGLEHADQLRRDDAPASVNRATGGYIRGLGLADAIDALPLYQRAALVTGYFLDWTDEFTAHGFETPTASLQRRRERALSFVGHHLRLVDSAVEPLVREHLHERATVYCPTVADAASVRRRGRQRTLRNRLAALVLVVCVIALGGALFQTRNDPVVVVGPEPVDGPRTSPSWFDPVSNGRGEFVALNTSGSAKFVESSDGSEWFDAANWNSRAIDIRTEVTGFSRTGDRYVTSLEALGVFGEFIPPRIAVSQNLREWNVRELPVEAPTGTDGLRRGYRVITTAGSTDRLLVAVETTEELDHRFFEVRPDEVCGERAEGAERQYFLCDGETVLEVSVGEQASTTTNFFVAGDTEPFRSVELPPDTSPHSLVGFSGGFAVADANQGQVWVSPDGESWERATTSSSPNRFVLLDGNQQGALVIEPDAAGWSSRVIASSGLGATGDIPLAVDPESVWTQPDVASGPAGWALFVTTARPWERSGDVSGWAVATPSWIVSQLPDAATITAQSVPDGTTLRLAADGPWVQSTPDGTIVLRNPTDGDVLVEITERQIEQARPTPLDQARIKAQVFFSADGVSWTSVWASTDDAWSGSVAVGDDEILLSGTQLTGVPISIPLPES